MKIGPVFAPIFKHHQKLIFDAERVGLATGRLLLAFGVRKHRRHRFKCIPLNTGKPPEYFAFQLFDRINSHRRLPLAATNQTGVKRGLCKRSSETTSGDAGPHFCTLGCLWVAELSTTAWIAIRTGTCASAVLRKRMNSWCRWRCMLRPMTVPSSPLRAANSVVGPWRL